MTQPVLRSARLVLTPLAPAHLPLEVELDTDPAVMRYLGGPRTPDQVDEAHARRRAQGRLREGLGHWIATTGTELVGLGMLPPAHGPDQPDDRDLADLGYRLAPRAWGLGYGTEIAELLLEHAFEHVGMREVIAQTRVDNLPSRRLLERVGLRHVRDYRPHGVPPEQPGDAEYRLDAVAWRAATQDSDLEPRQA